MKIVKESKLFFFTLRFPPPYFYSLLNNFIIFPPQCFIPSSTILLFSLLNVFILSSTILLFSLLLLLISKTRHRLSCKKVKFAYRTHNVSLGCLWWILVQDRFIGSFRGGPLEKLWWGRGIFEPQVFFFCYQIPCVYCF